MNNLSVFGNQDMFLLVLFVHIFFPCDMLVFSLSEKLCVQAFIEFLNPVCLVGGCTDLKIILD